MHPVDKYCARPAQCSDLTFTQYFRQHILHPEELPSRHHLFVAKDTFGQYVYKRGDSLGIVRFTSCHPVNNTEGFCYNLLLNHLPFRSEIQLLGTATSYFQACVQRGLLRTVQDLYGAFRAFCEYNLLDDFDLDSMVQHVLCQRLDSSMVDMECGDLQHGEMPPEAGQSLVPS